MMDDFKLSSRPGECWTCLLPSEVFQRVLSFLDYSDRQELSIANKRLCEEVEVYSKQAYKAIKREHRVDRTYVHRVEDQANIQTGRKKPVKLPYRFRVRVGASIFLHRISLRFAMERPLRNSSIKLLSKNLLAVFYDHDVNDNCINLFDLTTGLDAGAICPVSLTSQSIFLLEDNRILTCGDNKRQPLMMWTKSATTEGWQWSGESFHLESRLADDNARIITYTLHEHEIFCFVQAFSNELEVVSINMHDGSLATRFTVGSYVSFSSIQVVTTHGVSGQKWLPFSVYSSTKEGCGYYVYNVKTNQRRQFLPDTNSTDRSHGLLQASDCSKTFWTRCGQHSKEGFALLCFQLGQDGCLSQCNTFPVLGGILIAASKSQLFIRRRNDVYSYNVSTGKRERVLRPLSFGGLNAAVVSTSRRELFVKEQGAAIKVFCLEEPSFI